MDHAHGRIFQLKSWISCLICAVFLLILFIGLCQYVSVTCVRSDRTLLTGYQFAFTSPIFKIKDILIAK